MTYSWDDGGKNTYLRKQNLSKALKEEYILTRPKKRGVSWSKGEVSGSKLASATLSRKEHDTSQALKKT